MSQENKTGIWYAASAYIAWGILPVYWHFLSQIPAMQILAHRIFWSFIFVALFITIKKQWSQMRQVFTSRKTIIAIIFCSIFISANWFIYIWAVNNGHVIETSLGYYINPLISIAFGTIFLKEKLDKWQWSALACAFIGVIIQTVEFGQLPWIAISLAITFALYGLGKKLLEVEAIISLALETMIVAPFAFGYLLYVQGSNQGAIGHISVPVLILLVGTGIVTALPLLWFARGAKRVSLSTMGFIQYFSPTITLLLGVFFFHESFRLSDLYSFSFIWLALVIYTISRMTFFQQLRRPFVKW